MKLLFLAVGLVLLVSSIVIIFTESKRDALGLAICMSCVAGYCFRITTEEN